MAVYLYPVDCLTILRVFPDQYVNCVVTSPPYWGLRDYGLEPTVWDGDSECEHDFSGEIHHEHREQVSHGKSRTSERFYGGDQSRKFNSDHQRHFSAQFCRCGAWSGSLGLEPTPELYVEHLVEIFREVKRVLRDAGTLWLNLGDSYVGAPKGNLNGQDKSGLTSTRTQRNAPAGINKLVDSLKPKDLVGIPWRVAFALQADGWYLRSDIIWHKPNPMPESVKDRPTKAHEYIFLLSKSAKYYYDADAIKEPVTAATVERLSQSGLGEQLGSDRVPGKVNGPMKAVGTKENRNKRTVWTITTQSFKGAHFATFPQKLIEPCILAGCPEGGMVLDPFAGSGTVGVVATANNRNAILMEANTDYADLIRERNNL